MRGYTSVALAMAAWLVTGGLAAAERTKEEQLSKDRKALAGTWLIVSRQVNGEKMPPGDLSNMEVTFQPDGGFKVEREGNTIAAGTTRISLDPGKKIRTMDTTIREGGGKGRIQRGVYKIEGDRLTICIAAPDRPRPADFSAPAGSGRTLMVLRRKK